MAKKKALEKISAPLTEVVKNFVETLDKNADDTNSFLEKKAIGLTIELYQQTTDYDCDKVLKKIVEYCEHYDCLYAYCLHDSDYFTDNTFNSRRELIGRKGEKKQNHYHVVIQFNYETVIGDFVAKLDIPDEDKFCRFIKKLRKPMEIDNMLLYLSHIKYPNKHQYHDNNDITKYIKSNRLEYVNYLHLTYHPKSAIKYTIKLSQDFEGRYLRKEDVFLACDEAEIGYDDYLKAYRVIKDIVDEHNRELEIVSPKLEKAYMRMAEEKKADEKKTAMNEKRIRELAETFGCLRVEFDGKEMMVVNVPERKKLFDEPKADDNSIDMIKESLKNESKSI